MTENQARIHVESLQVIALCSQGWESGLRPHSTQLPSDDWLGSAGVSALGHSRRGHLVTGEEGSHCKSLNWSCLDSSDVPEFCAAPRV